MARKLNDYKLSENLEEELHPDRINEKNVILEVKHLRKFFVLLVMYNSRHKHHRGFNMVFTEPFTTMFTLL